MPAQKTAGAKSAKPKTGVPARELWLNAVKTRTGTLNTGSRKPGHPGKRSPEEYWTDTLRKSGTLNHEGGDTFSGVKKPSDSQMAYLSTPHFMRQMAGTEKSRRSQDPTARTAPGTPAYKSPEEYYDDILALKKQVTALNTENSTLKARLRRMEDSHLKKEKEIDQLLDPTRSEELRRTLADKKPDTGTTIHSLKQRILRLEQQLRDKESAYIKLQSDMKNTKVEEMKVQMEAFYGEIVRLQSIKAGELAKSQRPQTMQTSSGSKENTAKIKALNETILRMNEKNVRLTQENKSLKEDLEKLFEEQEKHKASIEEYEDMNKKQLLAAVTKLEQRLEKAETDNQSVTSEIEERNKEISGKMKLEGSMAQKLDQLDKRETELLSELQKVTGSAKKLKEDRLHYRKQADEKDKEIKKLKREIDDLHVELQTFYDRDKSAPPKISPRRPKANRRDSKESIVSYTSARSENRAEVQRERERQKRIEEFQQNRAAKSIQRGWKDRQRRIEEDETNKVQDFLQTRSAIKIQRAWRSHNKANEDRAWRHRRDVKVEAFREDRAARKIQNGWISYQSRKRDAELDDAAETIQSALRGHKTRQKQMNRARTPTPRRELDDGLCEEDDDAAVETIQSAFRGHRARTQQLKRPPSRSRTPEVVSDEEEDDEAVETIQSAVRGHWTRKQNAARPRTPSVVGSGDEDEEAILTIQSAMRGHMARRRYTSPSTSPRVSSARRSSRGKLDSAGEELEDEDSDEMIVSSSRRNSARRNQEEQPSSARRPSSARKDSRDHDHDIRGSRRSLSDRKSPRVDEENISSSRHSARKSPREEQVSSARRPSSARKSPISTSRTSVSRETPRSGSRQLSKADVAAKDEETDDDDDICF